jgi:hypothetical protein
MGSSMSEKNDPDSTSDEQASRRIRLFLTASIPVYLAIAALLYYLLPSLAWLALIPILLAGHSIFSLLFGIRTPGK